jgi:3-deoxy-D-arabino-heptulosonate 7-phosphate (DAHP) synthase
MASKVFNQIVIDISHENCSKKFIQMLLRMDSFKTI